MLSALYMHITMYRRIYNYSKTASRGAKDFLLEVDGLYLHMGTLLRADRYGTPAVIV